MRREKAGKVFHEQSATKSKEFLSLFSFVTEWICYQLNKPIILSM